MRERNSDFALLTSSNSCKAPDNCLFASSNCTVLFSTRLSSVELSSVILDWDSVISRHISLIELLT